MMIELNRFKKRRSRCALFNPYKNGISTYDMAYLSSKNCFKNKNSHIQIKLKKDYFAA